MRSRDFRIALLTGFALSLGADAQAQEATAIPAAPVAIAPEGGGSSVRIVRLSEVRGIAQLDRNTGMGFEPAFANIPVVAGAKLRTGEGVAEVEFEDNSTLRLTPSTEVRFAKLSRMPTGGTVTTIEVLRGTAYVSLEKTAGNAFALTDSAAEVVLAPGSHVRLETKGTQARLAVFDGNATLVMEGVSTAVPRRKSVELDTGMKTVSAVEGGTEEEGFDAWDKQGQEYHKLKANALTNTGGFGAFGANDLNYYGSFVDMPGCGSMWRPYFANAAWDPFAAGVWAWYPTAGYSWVSPYPWGWLPFHSGTWASCGSAGWGWRPGGAWYGINNVPTMRIARHIPHTMPPPPVMSRPGGTLVPVNMKELTVSQITTGERFTFRQNSAGLGVPRASFGDLRRESVGMERHGDMTRGVSSFSMREAAPMPMHREPGGNMEAARNASLANAGRMGVPGANGIVAAHGGWDHGGGAAMHSSWSGAGNGGSHGGWSGGGGNAGSGMSHGGWSGGGGSAGGGGGHVGGGGGGVSAGASGAGGGGAAGGHH